MNSPEGDRIPVYRIVTIIAGVVLVLLFVALVAALGIGGILPSNTDFSPSATPVLTSTPYILVHKPAKNQPVRFEAFTFGLQQWRLATPFGKIEDIEHKLVLQSYVANMIAVAVNSGFIAPSRRYYLQADFVTDTPTGQAYGLVFGSNEQAGTFYTFELWPYSKTCLLTRFTEGKWDKLASGNCASLHAYPGKNTLSIFFDDGRIELYLNGNSVLFFVDKGPLRSAGIGVYVSNAGFRLIVDNLFAYSEQ